MIHRKDFAGCISHALLPNNSGPMAVNSIGGMNTWTPGWWIFYVAPFVGAGFAALTYKTAFAEDDEVEEAKGKQGVLEESTPAVSKSVAAGGGEEEEVEVSHA